MGVQELREGKGIVRVVHFANLARKVHLHKAKKFIPKRN